jgi:palmitoyltransferase
MFDRIRNGRTDLVLDYLRSGKPAHACDEGGVTLLQWCAYYGDVTALRFLLEHGETLNHLGPNHDLHGAAFHGHWRLCQFLLEHGAEAAWRDPDNGETALHSALCKFDSVDHERVVRVLLAFGAKPNVATQVAKETGGFMRDVRTRGETPLHRAAAFGTAKAIELLLNAGAAIDARDAYGDSPLSWASWHLRDDAILRQLCFGEHRIHPERRTMHESLLGEPQTP